MAWTDTSYKHNVRTIARIPLAGFPGGDSLRAAFLPWLSGPDARHHGRYEPEGQLSVACAWLVLLVMMLSRCVPCNCRQARVHAFMFVP